MATVKRIRSISYVVSGILHENCKWGYCEEMYFVKPEYEAEFVSYIVSNRITKVATGTRKRMKQKAYRVLGWC